MKVRFIVGERREEPRQEGGRKDRREERRHKDGRMGTEGNLREEEGWKVKKDLRRLIPSQTVSLVSKV